MYIGGTGRPTQGRIKEHDRDIRLTRTEISADSEHAHKTGHEPLWNEIKFIDRDPYYNTCKVKEAIHINKQGKRNRNSRRVDAHDQETQQQESGAKKTISDKTALKKSFICLVFRTSKKNPSPHISFATQRSP